MNYIFLMAPAAGGNQDPYSGIIFLVAVIFIFYFFMIRPQMKKQKEIKKFREGLKKGDKIVTSGGIYGKINDIKDNAFIIEIAPNVTIKVDKSAVLGDFSDAEVKK